MAHLLRSDYLCIPRLDSLRKELHAQFGVAASYQLVFSPTSPHSLSPNTAISQDTFKQLMEKCGAARGNGMLYLLPINEVQKSEGGIDFSCLSQLSELNTPCVCVWACVCVLVGVSVCVLCFHVCELFITCVAFRVCC